MRLHHYPGLFGDPRSRGLRWAVGVSLAVHAVLFAAAGHMRTRLPERTFFAPVHIVDLVERSPGPATKAPPQAPVAAPPSPATAPKPKAEPKAPAPPATPKPPPAAQKPKITRESVERLLAKPTEVEKPAPPPQAATEERISERIARMREKYATPTPPPASAAGTDAPAGEERRVEDAIASIRKRAGPAGAGSGSDQQVGVRGGSANTLQQVRLRAYYNQLWDHVTSHWAIPPSLQGRDYAVIVSVIFDRQGKLVRSWVEEPSGSDAFDRSALQALQRAQPLPPIPDSVSGDTLEVGFRFHPD